MESILRDIQLFVTYAHEDEPYRARLGQHLKLFERKGAITCWHDRLITPGKNWAGEIDESMARSDVVIALVSAAFLASDYCYEVELSAAIERHKFGRSRLIPVIVRPAAWHESPLGELQALPVDGKPVSTWSNEDEAWANVTEGILKVVGEIREQKETFLNAIPTVLRDYFAKRAELISGDDSEVTRNITRLRSKNHALWKKLEDYRQLAIAHTDTIEKKCGELYDLIFSKAGALSSFLIPMMLLELNEEHTKLLTIEGELISMMEDAKLNPYFFGLPSTLENSQDLLATGDVTVKLLGSTTHQMKQFKQAVLAPVREIGEKAYGDDFEEPERGRAIAGAPKAVTEDTLERASELTQGRKTLAAGSVTELIAGFCDPLRDGGEGPEMVTIPEGEFQMGGVQGDGHFNERPVHKVIFGKPFAIGRYAVTFEEYDSFVRSTGYREPKDFGWGRGTRPVIDVTWDDAIAYTEWLSEQTGKPYRLPSEAEWEYAARAGTDTTYWWGNDIRQNGEVWANCIRCGSEWDDKQTAPVGSFQPNTFGLYDTSGNVWEWVQDYWHESYEGSPDDGSAWEAAGGGDLYQRVVRGGSWSGGLKGMRSADRYGNYRHAAQNFLGFRLARNVAAKRDDAKDEEETGRKRSTKQPTSPTETPQLPTVFHDVLKDESEGPEMVVIAAGRFLMGSAETDQEGYEFERPQHKVTLVRPFALGMYPVTFEEYDRFAEATGHEIPDDHGWGRGNRPVINVSWEDATAYAEWLAEQTGKQYRLPTEAEWEYCARAGTTSAYWWGDELGEARACCDGCGSRWDAAMETAPVGSFAPNPWGLHDMAGNVEEWVQDCWHANYEHAPDDGSVWLDTNEGDCRGHVLRGGSCIDGRSALRSAYRNWMGSDYRDRYIGFRLARDIVNSPEFTGDSIS